MKKLLLSLLPILLFADFDYVVDNTNFTINQGSVFPDNFGLDKKTYTYNYDRLRVKLNYDDENFFVHFIGDSVNYLGEEYVDAPDFEYITLLEADTPFKTQTKFYDYKVGSVYAKLYRFNAGYEDEDNRIVLGLQNITMGVGRLWNPTNLFNPKNIYALEADEVFGVAAISYTRYLNSTSQVSVVASEKKDKTFKYAARYKAFLEYADMAVDAIYSDQTIMIGYELEGNLADTGIELRSEGAYIKNSLAGSINPITKEKAFEDTEFFQAILGADYGFENGLTLTLESLYSSQKFSFEQIFLNVNSEILSNLTYSKFYLGGTLSYTFNIFLDGSLLYIESFNTKNSRFISPTLTYTLNDYNSFIAGAMIQNGENGSEFGSFNSNTYFFKYALTFWDNRHTLCKVCL